MDTLSDRIAGSFVEVSCRSLDTMTGFVERCLLTLSEEQIWQREAAHENMVGNLLLHLCGNARQWVIHGVGGAEDVRSRDAEFHAEGGCSGAELAARFAETMAKTKEVIRAVTAERLMERIMPQGYDVTVLEAVYHVVEHVHQHVGQIILLTKQMTARDLDLTLPRPR